MNSHPSRFYIPSDHIVDDNYQTDRLRPQANRTWKRLLLFASIFILSATVSLSYTFKRPAIYESSAELLIESQDPNQRDQDTSTHDIALQHQILLSRDLLIKVLDSLPPVENNHELDPLTLSSLQPMLKVTSVADSAIIKLQAEGPEKTILPTIVNTWLGCYVDLNSQMQKNYSHVASESLQQQLEALKNKVAAKHKKLKSFREKYDIVSMERDENKTLSILKGLNRSLNKGTETGIIAQANLIAVKDAIEQRKWAGNYKKTTELVKLENEAELLRELVSDYKERYKPQFIQMDKDTRATINKLGRLEEKIELKYQELRTAAIEEAEQEIKSSREAEKDLKKRIVDYEKKASTFSARFSEHESLKEDLLRLENLNRDYQEKLVAMEIKSDGDMLQVKVLGKPFLPKTPVRPNYMRDAGISIAASLLSGVFAILLYDLLTRPGKQPDDQIVSPVTYNQVFQSMPPALQALSYKHPTGMLLPPAEHIIPRELSLSEVKGMYNSADNITRRLIAGIFNGLTVEETAHLKWGHINFETNELKTPGNSPRIILLTKFHRSVLEKDLSAPVDQEAYVLQNKKGGLIPADSLEEYISHSARQAQITEPKEITAQVLRHTYIAFLARQGVSLREIVERVGYIPGEYHAAYDIMRPPGSGISIKNAEQVFPVLGEDI